MTTAREVAAGIEVIAPLASGIDGDELGFVWGDPDQVVRGIACLWCAHAGSLRACAERDLNCIITHEGLWLPPQRSPWYEGPSPERIHSNRVRRELLDVARPTIYRSHSNWDVLRGDGVPDQAVSALGIPGLREVARQPYFSVQELPAPMSVAALHAAVQKGFDYGACRVFGDGERQVRRVAVLIGGFGENQHHMPQAAADLGAEAIIIGEMSEFIVIACLEQGLPVIETLHSVSEQPAIRRQAELLAARFPQVPVHYIPSGALSLCPSAAAPITAQGITA